MQGGIAGEVWLFNGRIVVWSQPQEASQNNCFCLFRTDLIFQPQRMMLGSGTRYSTRRETHTDTHRFMVTILPCAECMYFPLFAWLPINIMSFEHKCVHVCQTQT